VTHNERRRGNGQGTTIPKHIPATHSERRRGQQPGQHDQFPATHNERRRGHSPAYARGLNG
jgi:hypothetical protein